jgi:hypothetical protein
MLVAIGTAWRGHSPLIRRSMAGRLEYLRRNAASFLLEAGNVIGLRRP